VLLFLQANRQSLENTGFLWAAIIGVYIEYSNTNNIGREINIIINGVVVPSLYKHQ
jgi:hypothetical protein